MIRNIVGTVVRGKDFFDRDCLVEQLWRKLETTNVLLAAPRRFGKTSVMYHLLDSPRAGYYVIHFDLEPVTEPVDFVVTLVAKLREDKKIMSLIRHGAESLRKFLENVEFEVSPSEGVDFRIGLKEKLKKDWRDVGRKLLAQLARSEKKILLIFDELTMMLENFLDGRLQENEVREFLYWFRQLRIDPGTTQCRFLLGSSISIDRHLSKLNATASMNDFERVVLGEFDSFKIAARFVDELLKGQNIEISKPSKQRILSLVGPPIPYFIQVLVSEILKKFDGPGRCVTKKNVEELYQDTVLGVSCKSYFQHYYDRLLHYGKLHERAAKALLKKLALTGEVPKETLYQYYLTATQQDSDMEGFNDLMSDLENDFYIKYQHAKYSYIFFSKILRDWWRRYYSL